MNLLSNKYFRWGLAALVILITAVRSFMSLPYLPKDWQKGDSNFWGRSNPDTYDEQMWTSSSITSYHMYFKNYVRPTKELDNWFPAYAWKNGVDVFTGDSLIMNPYTQVMQYRQDTIHFPYDQITITKPKEQYALAVKYDTTKFNRKDFQWFDRATWTFGWKAPNLGKYIMGWWIQTFAKNKPNPNGYFEYYLPLNQVDTNSTEYTPSTKTSASPFAYTPKEYQQLARQPNALLNILTVVLVVLAGWFFFHYWVGIISGLWLALNATFIKVNCMIGLDSFAAFFSMLAFFTMLATARSLYKNEAWWKVVIWGIATGLASAFAVSSKLNAGMVIIVNAIYFGMIGLVLLWKGIKLKQLPTMQRFGPLLKALVAGLLTGVLSIVVFIKLNPQVQGQPRERIATIRGSVNDYFDRRARIFTNDQINKRMRAINEEVVRLSTIPTTNQQSLMSVNQQLVQLSQRYNTDMQSSALNENKFYLTKVNKYYKDLEKVEKQLQMLSPDFSMGDDKFVNWLELKHSWYLSFELVAKRVAVVDGDRYYGTIGSLLKFKYNGLDGILAILGLVFALLMAWRHWKEKKEIASYGFLLVSFILIFYGNVDFVWQDWPRYMTPVFPLYSMMIALGIVEGVKWIKERRKNKGAVTEKKKV